MFNLFILGQALPAHLVPCWWVGWLVAVARAVSRKTPIYFIYVLKYIYAYILPDQAIVRSRNLSLQSCIPLAWNQAADQIQT